MFKHTMIATALVVSASAAGATTVIDFASVPQNTEVTTQYAGQGVTFRGLEDGGEVATVTADFPSPTGDRYFSNCYPTRCASRADILEISFTEGASDVSWTLDSEGGLSITFNAYDDGGALLQTFDGTGDGVIFGFGSLSGIARIDALQPNDGWGWGLAQLTFDANVSAVPLPATLPLLFGAFGGLGLLRRFKKALPV
jgi:hypothetical protein